MRIFANSVLMRFFLAILLSALFSGCDRAENQLQKVSLAPSEKADSPPPGKSSSGNPPLRVAISAIISPQETLFFYKDLLDYMSKKLDIPILLVQRETYKEVNTLLKNNELDMAFICSGAYIEGHEDSGLELLAVPVVFGQAAYYSYIIVPVKSPAKSLKDLRHKKFAFTDPLSNTGQLYPSYLLDGMNETSDTFFSGTTYTYSHDRSIEMVAYSLVDGAAVDNLIWEYMNARNPVLTSKTKVIIKSEPFGIPPVVVPPGLDPVRKERIRNLFLNIHNDAEGKGILDKMMIDRFTLGDDHQYDSIRKMNSRIKKKQ